MSRTESLSRARQRAADIRRLCYLREERDAQRTLVKRLNSFGNTFRALHARRVLDAGETLRQLATRARMHRSIAVRVSREMGRIIQEFSL